MTICQWPDANGGPKSFSDWFRWPMKDRPFDGENETTAVEKTGDLLVKVPSIWIHLG